MSTSTLQSWPAVNLTWVEARKVGRNSSSMDLLRRVLKARYRLDEKLGTGGSARVYAAHDLVLRRTVAVKVLHPALADDARFLRRFEAEARAAAALQHPHIVSVFDSGADDVVFMVLELLEGGSLQDLLDEGRTLTPEQAAGLGAEVCAALGFAHRRGVVHRDVKPGNILFTADGHAKVADFGLARALAEASWTEPLHSVLGTARYSPPEVLRGEPPGPAGDIYSLGLVLSEAVAGVPVFRAETPVAVLAGRLQGAPSLPAELGPLTEAVATATSADPVDRYADAGEMQAALDLLAGDTRIQPAGARRGGRTVTTNGQDTSQQLLPAPGTSSEPLALGSGSRRRRRRWLPLALVALLVFLVATLAPLYVFSWAAHRVADVRGLDVAAATSRLKSEGIGVTVGPPVPDYVLAPGQVLAIEPPVGTRVRWHGRVRLVPSAGLPQVDVPEVKGKILAEAAQALVASQLRVGKVEAVPDPAPALTVLDQEAGRRTAFDAVAVKVSTGLAAPAVVPDVTGQPLAGAQGALKEAGLADAVAAEAFDDAVPAGAVVSQDPGPAARVRTGRVVDLVVSKGPELVAVPDVRGAALDRAVERIRSAGLVPVVNEVTGREFVLKTAPDAGTKLKRGAEVTLYTI